MGWVWKSPKGPRSTSYALRDDAVRAAVEHAHISSSNKSVLKRQVEADQIELLWKSLKRAGWSVYQVDK